MPGMDTWPLKMVHYISSEDNFDIYIEDKCIYSRFYEKGELTFNLEGYGKFKMSFNKLE